jgi:hypothetical protein
MEVEVGSESAPKGAIDRSHSNDLASNQGTSSSSPEANKIHSLRNNGKKRAASASTAVNTLTATTTTEWMQMVVELNRITAASAVMHRRVTQLTELCQLLRQNLHVACEKLEELGHRETTRTLDLLLGVDDHQLLSSSWTSSSSYSTPMPNNRTKRASSNAFVILDENGCDVVAEAESIVNSVKSSRSRRNTSALDLVPISSYTPEMSPRPGLSLSSTDSSISFLLNGVVNSIAKQQQVVDKRGLRIERLEHELNNRLKLSSRKSEEFDLVRSRTSSSLPSYRGRRDSEDSMGILDDSSPTVRKYTTVVSELDENDPLAELNSTPRNHNRRSDQMTTFTADSSLRSELDCCELAEINALGPARGISQKMRQDYEPAAVASIRQQMEVLWCALNISEDELDRTKQELARCKRQAPSLNDEPNVQNGLDYQWSGFHNSELEELDHTRGRQLVHHIELLERRSNAQIGSYQQEISLLKEEINTLNAKIDAIMVTNIEQTEVLKRALDGERARNREQLRVYAEKCVGIQRTLTIERVRFEELLRVAEAKCGSKIDINYMSVI